MVAMMGAAKAAASERAGNAAIVVSVANAAIGAVARVAASAANGGLRHGSGTDTRP